MDQVILHPAYFGPISQYVALVKSKKVIFENEDNFQKQTYRNRMYIYDSNGSLLLNIPMKHRSSLGIPKNTKQKFKDIQIENDFDWQKNHWRALKNSYQTSPFFEFYEDELNPLYHKKFKYLMDFNYDCLAFVLECLQFAIPIKKTKTYQLEGIEDAKDYRQLINAKSKHNFQIDKYTQVFEAKHGFISNLSILDLIFNEGTNALNYLQNQNLQPES